MKIKSFLKYSGGKQNLVSTIRNYYPLPDKHSIKKYCEPFVGGGSILLDVLQTYDLDEVYISDYNLDIINLWTSIRDNVDELLNYLELFCKTFRNQSIDERKLTYYKQREELNSIDKSKNIVYSGALFLFLNKTGYNGLSRYNKSGKLNTSCGHMTNVEIYNKDNIRSISNLIHNVEIVHGDYKLCRDFIDSDTFVYFDPPYRKVYSSKYTIYNDSFGDDKQIELASFVKECSDKGAYILLSNSDPHNIDPNDNFFDDLYKNFTIQRIIADRRIQSGTKCKVYEILVHN